MGSECVWNKPENPPEGDVGNWTRDVVAYTNLGNVYKLAYYTGDKNSGIWQRPGTFLPFERIILWTEIPEILE